MSETHREFIGGESIEALGFRFRPWATRIAGGQTSAPTGELSCGCQLQHLPHLAKVRFCPLHKAAPALLEALEETAASSPTARIPLDGYGT